MIYQVVSILRFKTSVFGLNLYDYSDAYIVVKGRASVRGTNDAYKRNKKLLLRMMLHLDHAYQKSMTH